MTISVVQRRLPAARISRSIEETREFARECALAARPDDIWLLSGPLGAGKTLFVQAFLAARGGTEQACSPTFSLMQSFVTPSGPVHHMDFYRLEHVEELYSLGFEDALADGLSMIEWPEMTYGHPMLNEALLLRITPLANEPTARALEVAPYDERKALKEQRERLIK